MDVVLHPNFAANKYVYIAYTKPVSATKRVTAISRSKWDGKGLTETKDIVTLDFQSTSRIAFGKDGTLFMTTVGDPADADSPQKLSSQGGKVLRFKDDGIIPSDNPFVGRAGA